MSEGKKALGIDIGGTRVKAGVVNLETLAVTNTRVIPTERGGEERFLRSIAGLAGDVSHKAEGILGAGTSVGSYVYADGSIDGMSSFVPFLTAGYPLAEKLRDALGLDVRVDNDARLIALAEAFCGEARGAYRSMTLTLGTGIGVGVVEDKKPLGRDSYIHLAGHIRVRNGGEYPALDSERCYCGMSGCFEGTCSGTSLEKYVRSVMGGGVTNERMFELAAAGDRAAGDCAEWYAGMLSRALNQYVYIYCPEVIVLGGGVAKGLSPWLPKLQERMTASVYTGQRTELRLSSLAEDSGVLGAALLFMRDEIEP